MRALFELSEGYLNMFSEIEASENVTDELLQELEIINEKYCLSTQNVSPEIQNRLNQIED